MLNVINKGVNVVFALTGWVLPESEVVKFGCHGYVLSEDNTYCCSSDNEFLVTPNQIYLQCFFNS